MKTNEIIMNIYVTDEEVENHFSVCRPDCVDEDDYQEKCDETDMSVHDIDIAMIQKGTVRYFIFTSANKWNVYLGKEKWTGKPKNILPEMSDSWEVIKMDNITSDIDEWTSVRDVSEYLLGLNFHDSDFRKEKLKINLEKLLQLKIIKRKAVKTQYWLSLFTFVLYFDFDLKELQQLFPDKIEDDEYVSFYAEYQEDNHKIIYMLEFEDSSIDVSEYIQSLNYDKFVLDIAKEF